MNEYFTSIGPNLATQVAGTDIEPESYVDGSESTFVFKSININEVYNMLSNLKTSKSFGPDKIPARLLKDSCYSIAPFLTKIFNASLTSSVFPQEWKIALTAAASASSGSNSSSATNASLVFIIFLCTGSLFSCDIHCRRSI